MWAGSIAQLARDMVVEVVLGLIERLGAGRPVAFGIADGVAEQVLEKRRRQAVVVDGVIFGLRHAVVVLAHLLQQLLGEHDGVLAEQRCGAATAARRILENGVADLHQLAKGLVADEINLLVDIGLDQALIELQHGAPLGSRRLEDDFYLRLAVAVVEAAAAAVGIGHTDPIFRAATDEIPNECGERAAEHDDWRSLQLPASSSIAAAVAIAREN